MKKVTKKVTYTALLKEALHDLEVTDAGYRLLCLMAEHCRQQKIELGECFTFPRAIAEQLTGKTDGAIDASKAQVELRGYICRQGLSRTAPPMMVWRFQPVREQAG